jgi:hypothetical protein
MKIIFILVLAIVSSQLLAKEPKKQQVLESKFDRVPASTGKEISAVKDNEAKWHVAQVIEQSDIKIKKHEGSVSLVSIYSGGIAMPFQGFLTIFDTSPQDGGDFGTFKTFSLGHYAGVLKLIDSKIYTIKADQKVLSLAFSSSVWDPNTDMTSVKVLRFRVNIIDGVISSKATVSLQDK